LFFAANSSPIRAPQRRLVCKSKGEPAKEFQDLAKMPSVEMSAKHMNLKS